MTFRGQVVCCSDVVEVTELMRVDVVFGVNALFPRYSCDLGLNQVSKLIVDKGGGYEIGSKLTCFSV